MASALVGLVPLGLFVAPSLLRNLFVLRSPWQLFHVAWVTLFAGATVLAMVTVVEVNAYARYEVGQVWANEPSLLRSAVQALALLSLALPVPVACLTLSRQEGVAGSRWAWVGSLVAGSGAGVLLLALFLALETIFLPPATLCLRLLPFEAEWHTLLNSLNLPHSDLLHPAVTACLLSRLGSGGFLEDGQLAPGHAQVTSGALLALLIYTGYYVIVTFRKAIPDRGAWFPPVFAVLILVLVGYFFAVGWPLPWIGITFPAASSSFSSSTCCISSTAPITTST